MFFAPGISNRFSIFPESIFPFIAISVFLFFSEEVTENAAFSPKILPSKFLLDNPFSVKNNFPEPSVIFSLSSSINKETSCNSAEPE